MIAASAWPGTRRSRAAKAETMWKAAGLDCKFRHARYRRTANIGGHVMRFVIAAIASILPSLAYAQSPSPSPPSAVTHVQTAAELAAVCDPAGSGVPRLEAIAYCQGFITSAGQYHALLHPVGGRSRPLFCPPTPTPTIAQSGLAFSAWMRANPAHSSEPALDGFLRWAQVSYPCAGSPRAPRPAR